MQDISEATQLEKLQEIKLNRSKNGPKYSRSHKVVKLNELLHNNLRKKKKSAYSEVLHWIEMEKKKEIFKNYTCYCQNPKKNNPPKKNPNHKKTVVNCGTIPPVSQRA